MKRITLLSALLAAIPLGMQAQDDLYFNPSVDKKEAKNTATNRCGNSDGCGLGMSDEEYNRSRQFSSYYQKIGSDSLGNDIIAYYDASGAISTDTIYFGNERYMFADDDDFAYSRRMNRFDNFYGWYAPYYSSYWYDPWYADRWAWGWHSPWYYDRLWSWPYYSSWSWHYGWGGSYWAWHPGYWGWAHPSYIWTGHTGTRNHSFARTDPSFSQRPSRHNTFGTQTRPDARPSQSNRNDHNGNSNRNFGGTQKYSPNQQNSGQRPNSPQQTAPRGSSFGGNRSFGGGNRGGGGSFGGGSRGGGGSHGSFGGRR